MSTQPEIQCESMHRTAAKQPKKNFGNLARGTRPQVNAHSRLGHMPTRQYFDSAEYSLSKEAQRKEEVKEEETKAEEKKKEQTGESGK